MYDSTPTYAPPAGLSATADRYWRNNAERVLRLPQCATCQAWRWYLPEICPQCRATELVWTDLPGTGTIFTYTVMHRHFLPSGNPSEPYAIALVDLDGADGCRLPANVVECEPERLVVGLRVEVRWRDLRTHVLPVFVPAE